MPSRVSALHVSSCLAGELISASWVTRPAHVRTRIRAAMLTEQQISWLFVVLHGFLPMSWCKNRVSAAYGSYRHS